ncbi:chemotaxis protein [Paenibacillus sp. GSMTC-2017]|uniref:chemotaxis protein n=1 Tax=Paenibacillus sp. GSMTC-2017 TaxID=2794350 RepID=UPI0018D9E127|nr:chemotaxis protein [Paenibacillus sp. GSMTC-2017]MBH5316194.1 chemotaxis protein [Paenibacillus sp. GSMTC-2017]
METKIAVIIIHGLGRQKRDFARSFVERLKSTYTKVSGNPSTQLSIEPVYWADIFEEREDQLYQTLVSAKNLHYKQLRRFVIHYLADAVAYQPVEYPSQNYEAVHKTISQALNRLSDQAGPKAPLCVIAHSLGGVIASNYFYDLQMTSRKESMIIDPLSALERGETLTHFFTLGTTLPLWSLRYRNFNQPVSVPSPLLRAHYAKVSGGWTNFYDKNDILGYPLRNIDPMYELAVKEDVEVKVGDWKTSWNPLCHSGYFMSKSITERIVRSLALTVDSIDRK